MIRTISVRISRTIIGMWKLSIKPHTKGSRNIILVTRKMKTKKELLAALRKAKVKFDEEEKKGSEEMSKIEWYEDDYVWSANMRIEVDRILSFVDPEERGFIKGKSDWYNNSDFDMLIGVIEREEDDSTLF